MNAKFLHFTSAILLFLCACERENINSSTNNIPVSITYQLYDTTTGSFNTFQSYKLYADSAGIYFDSIVTQPQGFPIEVTYSFDFLRFNSKKYLIAKNNFSTFDSTQAPIIKFNSDGRIIELLDLYDLNTESGGGGESFECYLGYANFSTGNPVLATISPNAISPSIRMTFLSFTAISANTDSIQIESGFSNEPSVPNPPTKYTVIFDSKSNNTNLMALSGLGSQLDAQGTNNTFALARKLPLPKLNMPLAKSIVLTQFLGYPITHTKMVDFSYVFDDNNRVTQAIIQNYNYDGSISNDNKIRILLNY